MRQITLNDPPPEPEWLEKAQAILQQLDDAPDKATRDQIIDRNKGFWGELKSWLLELSHNKCWFSEAKDCFSHWEVEHFRPKKSAKDLDGTTHDGYWWLSFDWTNFRICGNAGNRSKGTFFPLEEGCPRCTRQGDLRYEQHLLLDPANQYDPSLLSFNMAGEAIPDADVTDEWELRRVEYTITRCNLQFGPLVDKRKVVWGECWRRVQDFLRERQKWLSDRNNLVAKHAFQTAAENVRVMMRENEELSAVARACVESAGDRRLSALLRTN